MELRGTFYRMPNKIISFLKFINIINIRSIVNLLIYIVFSISNGVFESLSLLLLTRYFTGIDIINFDQLYISNFFSDINSDEFIIIGLLIFALISRLSVVYLDGWFNIKFRTSIQGQLIKAQLSSSWLNIRSQKIGTLVSTITYEALLAAKFLSSWISIFFNLIVILSIGVICLITDYKSSLLLWLTALPLLILVKYFYKKQSHLSVIATDSRSNFSSMVTECYAGFQQIKIEDDISKYINKVDNLRSIIDSTENKINIYQSVISSFSLISITFTFLIIFLFTIFMDGLSFQKTSILAIGVLSLKLSGYFSSLVASYGNINRLVGSFLVIFNQFNSHIPSNKKLLNTKISTISVNISDFGFFGNDTKKNYKFSVTVGCPLVITGPSGIGKTTLANLISGLIDDNNSNICYIDDKNSTYNSKNYKLKIGYVSQDIYLFSGSFKENLDPEDKFSNHEISNILTLVDALTFVNQSGGLYASVLESGKNLSGGQKRRLGIARALLSNSNIYIFDEITAGLDSDNTEVIYNLINKLSVQNIVIIITHDQNLNLKNSVTINMQ